MISTMNTRTGNAQLRGGSQLELEEDAMLTAIGQSSLDEMADKYADRWEDFVASLSRWRSIHQLLRLGQLNKALLKLAEQEAEISKSQKILKHRTAIANGLRGAQKRYSDLIQENINRTQRILEFGNNASIGKSGRKPYNQATAEAIRRLRPVEYRNPNTGKWETRTAGEWEQIFAQVEEWLQQQKQMRYMTLKLNDKLKAEQQQALDEIRTEKLRLQDQYDITKPYAMGLLVADIFYTLASAIQGEIYL